LAVSARPSSLHASDTLTRALAKRATSSRVTVNRRSCPSHPLSRIPHSRVPHLLPSPPPTPPPPPPCSLAGRATSAPNCQRAKYVLHSSRRFSLFTPVNRPSSIVPLASSHRVLSPPNSRPKLIVG